MRSGVVLLARRAERGFSLVEMIVVVFLLGVAMLGILAVFDASARINKNEQQVADAQGSVRYGIYQMTRAIRMAGSGGLNLRQAVLNAPDTQLAGITVPGGGVYDNVPASTTVTPLTGANIPVRPGTDMIEIRGVIGSPLIGFDAATGCGPTFGTSPCDGVATTLTTAVTVQSTYPHVNNDATNRPQFAAVDTYTQGAANNPMLVIVSFGAGSIVPTHNACTLPQNFYNVGVLAAPTTLVASNTFGPINFISALAQEFNTEKPSDNGTPATGLSSVRRAGVLDDFLYFIDDSDPNHPALAWGTRRGTKFDVVALADDVEDMQIAYGVDQDAFGTPLPPGYGGINRIGAPTATDPDQNVSNQANGDEWVPNAPGEAPFTADQFMVGLPPPSAQNCELLHGVMISLLARSKDPDPTYRAPLAQGLVLMNGLQPAPGSGQYRRRVQTLKINLRNYAFPG